MTLEKLKEQVAHLPPWEQLNLIVDISQRLSTMPVILPIAESNHGLTRMDRLAQIDAWMAECDEVAELWEGEFDSAADLRRIRDEEE